MKIYFEIKIRLDKCASIQPSIIHSDFHCSVGIKGMKFFIQDQDDDFKFSSHYLLLLLESYQTHGQTRDVIKKGLIFFFSIIGWEIMVSLEKIIYFQLGNSLQASTNYKRYWKLRFLYRWKFVSLFFRIFCSFFTNFMPRKIHGKLTQQNRCTRTHKKTMMTSVMGERYWGARGREKIL